VFLHRVAEAAGRSGYSFRNGRGEKRFETFDPRSDDLGETAEARIATIAVGPTRTVALKPRIEFRRIIPVAD